jgi:hypothetical protein
MKGLAVAIASPHCLVDQPTDGGMGNGRDLTKQSRSRPLLGGHGVRLATNWLAGSVASVLVNIVRNRAPAGAKPT